MNSNPHTMSVSVPGSGVWMEPLGPVTAYTIQLPYPIPASPSLKCPVGAARSVRIDEIHHARFAAAALLIAPQLARIGIRGRRKHGTLIRVAEFEPERIA
jgi:hypothetical protein